MIEPAFMPPFKEPPPKASWIYDGTKKDHRKLSYQQNEQTVANRLDQELVKANEQKWEAYYTDDAEFIFVSNGLPSRSAKKALGEDVALAVKKAGYEVPIYGMFTGGKIAKSKEIVGYYQDILAGCHKEVF